MARTKGAKYKNNNINTAKNKNIININVNSTTSNKRGKGRPRKVINETTNKRTPDLPPNSSAGYNSRPQYAPPPVPIITPSQDGTMSMLSQLLTSKILNESNRTFNIPDTTNLNYSRESVEPSRTFNSRESIIPRLPDTPLPIKNESVKPVNPPPPPPPPPPKQEAQKPQAGATGLDAIVQEIKYLNSEEGKAEKARKQAEAKEKREAKKLEKQASQQSTTDLSFPTPKKDIIEMITPQKEPKLPALTPVKENRSMLDFVLGGTPQKQKSAQEIKEEKRKSRLKELSKISPMKAKQMFEFNDLKSEFTGQPNPNQDIGSSIINRAIKGKIARKELEKKKEEKKSDAVKKIQTLYRGNKVRQHLATDKDFQNKIAMKIKDYGTAASEYHTRGKDSQEVNDEFSDIIKLKRTGLQNYKKTLGIQPKKPGPKPNPYKGLKQTEI